MTLRILALLGLLPLPLAAAIRHVDHTVPASGDGSSWASAFATLQEALAASSASDVIRIAAGSYHPDEGGGYADNEPGARFDLVEGVTLEGGYPNGGGGRDLSAHLTVLSGDLDGNDDGTPSGSNSQSVLHGDGLSAATVLDGLLIRGGLANGPGSDPFDGPTRAGGGAYFTDSSPTLRNVTFAGNDAGFGGGVFCIDGSSPAFINCVFSGNHAGFFGGGLNNRNNSSPTLVNCSFSGNSADSSSGGGAITNFAASNPSLTNCVLWNNRENGTSTTPQASVNDGGSTSTSYHSSLVQNLDPGGTNLDGTAPDHAPRFLQPSPPDQAPHLLGDLRLTTDSPALDAGDNAANSQPTDRAGAARIQDGIIDLGAYEGEFEPVIPEVLHVDQAVASPGDGSSWPDAFATLQDALEAAVGDQRILVAAGTYYPDEGGSGSAGDRHASFVLKNGIEILGGHPSGGGPRELAANPTILSGDLDRDDAGAPAGGNSHTLVRGSNVDPSAILDGFILTGGLADQAGDGDFEPGFSGGAIHLDDASPLFRNCWIRGNSARFGGGVEIINGASPTFLNCALTGNATDSYGGAINVRQSSAVTLVNCTLTGNRSQLEGGALYGFGANFTITNTLIWNNQSAGTRNSALASLFAAGSSSASFEHSLAHHLDPGGTNLDGTGDLNNPLFAGPVPPSDAPTGAGDLRPALGSPVLHAGDDTANTEPADLGGSPRIAGPAIDLGAFEGGVAPADTDGDGLADPFELAFTDPPSATALDPVANHDGDPFSALEEFGLGLSPDRPDPLSAAIEWDRVDDGGTDYLSIRTTVRPTAQAFVNVGPQQSLDLGQSDPWSNAGLVPLGLPAPWIGARSSLPFGSRDREFLRIRVVRKP